MFEATVFLNVGGSHITPQTPTTVAFFPQHIVLKPVRILKCNVVFWTNGEEIYPNTPRKNNLFTLVYAKHRYTAAP